MKIVVCIVTLVSMVLVPAATLGQAELPVSAYLPHASELGKTWTRVGTTTEITKQTTIVMMTSSDEVWKDGIVAVYAGPSGERVQMFALVPHDRAIEQASSQMTTWAAHYATSNFAEYDPVTPEESAVVPGCAAMARVSGWEDVVFLTGFSACALISGVVLVAVTSGAVFGWMGDPASDRVIELMIKTAARAQE